MRGLGRTIVDSVAKYIESEDLPQHPELKSNSLLARYNLRELFVGTPQSMLAGLEDQSPPFQVEVWVTEKGLDTFSVGDKLVFSVRSERKGYLYLLDINSLGSVTLFFPNHLDRNNFITAGSVVTVPDENFNAEFYAAEPVGHDTIIAIVSTQPWQELEKADINAQTILATLDAKQVTEVIAGALTRSATRGVGIRPKSAEVDEASDRMWALGKIRIEIRK